MARSQVVFVSLLLLCALALASPRASSGSSSDRLSKRQPAPKYKEDASSSSIGAYKNVFKPGDALLLQVQWWAETQGQKSAVLTIDRGTSPLTYSGSLGRVVVEKLTIPLAKEVSNVDNTTKIFIAATLCKHTPATVKGGCKADRARLGEAIRQNDNLQAVRTSPLRYLLRESAEEVMLRAPPLFVWRPKLKLQVVFDEDSYNELPELYRTVDSSYLPPAMLNNLELTEFEEVRTGAQDLTVEFSMLWIGKLEYYWLARVMQVFGVYEKFGVRGQELEDLKQTLLGNSWQVLYLTSIVAVFHLLFDILAFKNDISFWRKLKSMKGVSVRSLLVSFVCQVIVWLFLYDNDTSKLVLWPAAFGILIDLWKISKAINFRLRFGRGGVTLEMKEQDGYVNSHTKDFDKQAMRLVMTLLIPTVLAYASYSLVYNKHKGWYSWALESFTSVVYAAGFLLMLPQVFVNYKLRSVAAMPWRAFVYRALNTFIDDIFAFVIKMPTMHRLSCFRDDVVFVIYLYQRWIYPIDYTRATDTGKDDADASAGATDGRADRRKKNN